MLVPGVNEVLTSSNTDTQKTTRNQLLIKL